MILMSALPKHLLSLLILLLAGYGQLSATATASAKDIRGSEVSTVNSVKAFFITPISHKQQQKHTFTVLIESESENELVSFKKRLENSHYQIDVCFGRTASLDHFCDGKTTSINHYFSSDRCLLIRVFRI